MANNKRMSRQERLCTLRSRYKDDADMGDIKAQAVVDLCDCLEGLMVSQRMCAQARDELQASINGLYKAYPDRQRAPFAILLGLAAGKLKKMNERLSTPLPRVYGFHLAAMAG